jgi:ParB-like chromosome segregation protein Spo0J
LIVADLQRGSAWKAEVKDLVILDGFNCRDDYGDLEGLARQIEEHGVRESLRGYRNGDQCVITDGHRRYKAIQLLASRGVEIARVPFVIEDRKSSDPDYLLTQLLSNSGKPFSALEEAKVVSKLQVYGWSDQEIAKKSGFELSKVRMLATLDAAPEGMKAQVRAGELTQTAVIEAMRGTESNAEVVEVMAAAQALAVEENAPLRVRHVRQAKLVSKDDRTPDEIEAARQELISELAGAPWEVLTLGALEKVAAALSKVKHKVIA